MKRFYLYIILTRPNTIVSKLIHLIKKDEYTHAAISFDKDLYNMYSFGRKYVFIPFIGRFKRENINEGIYKLHNNLPGIVMEIEVTKKQYRKARSLLNSFILNNNLYKYNYLGLLDGLLNKPASHENRFLCSEFVYHLLKESGIIDLDLPENLVRPQNLLAIKSKIVFEGNLKEYYNKKHSIVEIRSGTNFMVMSKKAV